MAIRAKCYAGVVRCRDMSRGAVLPVVGFLSTANAQAQPPAPPKAAPQPPTTPEAKPVAAIQAAKQTDHLACTAGPPPTCRAGGAGEWDPVVHFMFGTGGRGRPLVLRAIAIDDEVLVGTDDLAIEHANQANLLAHLANDPWPLYNVPWR